MSWPKRVYFSIPGEVQPKQRPRFGKGGKIYTPQKTRAYEKLVGQLAAAARIATKEYAPFDGNINLEIVIFTAKDLYQFDIDNAAKAVLDGLNGILFRDDEQITKLMLLKTDNMLDDLPCVRIDALAFERDRPLPKPRAPKAKQPRTMRYLFTETSKMCGVPPQPAYKAFRSKQPKPGWYFITGGNTLKGPFKSKGETDAAIKCECRF